MVPLKADRESIPMRVYLEACLSVLLGTYFLLLGEVHHAFSSILLTAIVNKCFFPVGLMTYLFNHALGFALI